MSNDDIGVGSGLGDAGIALEPATAALEAALTAISIRLDSLLSTTRTTQGVLTEQVSEYADRVAALASNAVAEVQNAGRRHDETLSEVRRDMAEVPVIARAIEPRLDMLASTVRDLVSQVEQHTVHLSTLDDTLAGGLEGVRKEVAAALADSNDSMKTIADELVALRRRIAVNAKPPVATIGPEQISEIVERVVLAIGDELEIADDE